MITAIIADDEPNARERLKDLLARFGDFSIVAEAENGDQAVSAMIAHKPRVAFLDINMPGISVFSSIPALENAPLVVFQTAYSEHAANAYDIQALDYLLKPVRPERLGQTVEKIREAIGRYNSGKPAGTSPSPDHVTRIAVTSGSKTRLIPTKDIVRISFKDGCSHICTHKESLPSDKYLNHYEEKLKETGFFRISRTEIIKLDAISTIHQLLPGLFTVELKNGIKVDVSRRKARELKERVGF